ncbi:unannotated protein [freshwater metagenome]|uniref:Unannotated protein n=1 Tax=freshwater metagenome TaxID=449393 RepID=A0A6J7RK95_9ZZZZ
MEVLTVATRPGGDGPLAHGDLGVGNHQLGVDFEHGAKARAVVARAVGRVERKVAGRELLEGLAVARASQVLGEDDGLRLNLAFGALARQDLDFGHAFGQPERRLHRLGQPAVDAVAQHQPVDHDADGVHVVATEIEVHRRTELDQLAVDHGPSEALRCEVGQQRVVGALAAPHHRCEHLEARALREGEHAVDDLLGRLADEHLAGLGIVRDPDAGIEQPQVVIDLGDGAHGGPWVTRGRLLIDRDGRREALDEVDVGLVHLAEELAGVGRQGFDVAPLPLGVDRVEGERRFARARQAREHDELVARQGEIDVAEVVFASAANDELIGHGKSLGPAAHEHVFGPVAQLARTSTT